MTPGPGRPSVRKAFVARRSPSREPRVLREFPWAFAVATILALVASHWIAALIVHQVHDPATLIGLAAVALAGSIGLAIWIHHDRFSHHDASSLQDFGRIVVLLVLLDVCALAVHGVIKAPLFVFAFVLVLIFALIEARRLGEDMLRVKSLREFSWEASEERGPAAEHPPATDLIVFLTAPTVVPDIASEGMRITFATGQASVVLTRGQEIAEAIASFGEVYSNWQQILRALEPHLSALQRIHLIGSPNATGNPVAKKPGPLTQAEGNKQGSHVYLDECTALLRLFVHEWVDVRRIPKPVDFEDIETLQEKLAELVRGVRSEYPAARIVIETTGGLKTTSIAAAVATLNSPVAFQYVSTIKPFRVRLHDMRIEQPPEL